MNPVNQGKCGPTAKTTANIYVGWAVAHRWFDDVSGGPNSRKDCATFVPNKRRVQIRPQRAHPGRQGTNQATLTSQEGTV